MATYLLILRLLHICLGVFWAGGVIMMAGFLIPAVNASGPEGGKFMQQFARTNRFPMVMTLAATLTILSGFLLMERLSAGFTPEWFKTHYGMSLTAGGLLAVVAWLIGLIVNRPAAERMSKIGMEIAAQGGPPTPEQMKEMGALRGTIAKGARVMAIHLILAVALMAAARYV